MPACPPCGTRASGADVIRKANRRPDTENLDETHDCNLLLPKRILE